MCILYKYCIINLFFSIGKKKCWIRDGKNAYVEAEVKGSGDDGEIIVETTDGKVKGFYFILGMTKFSML